MQPRNFQVFSQPLHQPDSPLLFIKEIAAEAEVSTAVDFARALATSSPSKVITLCQGDDILGKYEAAGN